MAYLIGTDEAGYGPNLGPLVIAATLWRVPDPLHQADLYEVLGDTVSADPAASDDPARVTLADSKVLYQPQVGIARLEQGTLAVLAAAGHRPRHWSRLWDQLDPGSRDQLAAIPWYHGFDVALPLHADVGRVDEQSRRLHEGLASCRIELRQVRAQAVFPARFNAQLEAHGTKGAALSHTTLALVKDVLDSLDDERVFILCDKHGGRNRYAAFLQPLFPDHLVRIDAETRVESGYRIGPPSRQIEIRFRAKGEGFLPSAVASMVAKYLRETAMLAFNDFWQRRIPGLRRTAGYPTDARRFRAEIAPQQRELEIDDRVLWRNR